MTWVNGGELPRPKADPTRVTFGDPLVRRYFFAGATCSLSFAVVARASWVNR
jgi:hypothetical protein